MTEEGSWIGAPAEEAAPARLAGVTPAIDEEADEGITEGGAEGADFRFTERLTRRPSSLPRWMEMLPTEK